jgi:hypothetical protein
MTKTLTAKIVKMEMDSWAMTRVHLALMYRNRVIKEISGRDDMRLTTRIGRWAVENGFTAIRWVEPSWYVPSA